MNKTCPLQDCDVRYWYDGAPQQGSQNQHFPAWSHGQQQGPPYPLGSTHQQRPAYPLGSTHQQINAHGGHGGSMPSSSTHDYRDRINRPFRLGAIYLLKTINLPHPTDVTLVMYLGPSPDKTKIRILELFHKDANSQRDKSRTIIADRYFGPHASITYYWGMKMSEAWLSKYLIDLKHVKEVKKIDIKARSEAIMRDGCFAQFLQDRCTILGLGTSCHA
ncbi:hypothetical protein APHAL10511_000379 [Amanita phalloides]|nr:hypothetical protein APHAL10511_000379 [Amanita phalloides]